VLLSRTIVVVHHLLWLAFGCGSVNSRLSVDETIGKSLACLSCGSASRRCLVGACRVLSATRACPFYLPITLTLITRFAAASVEQVRMTPGRRRHIQQQQARLERRRARRRARNPRARQRSSRGRGRPTGRTGELDDPRRPDAPLRVPLLKLAVFDEALASLEQRLAQEGLIPMPRPVADTPPRQEADGSTTGTPHLPHDGQRNGANPEDTRDTQETAQGAPVQEAQRPHTTNAADKVGALADGQLGSGSSGWETGVSELAVDANARTKSVPHQDS